VARETDPEKLKEKTGLVGFVTKFGKGAGCEAAVRRVAEKTGFGTPAAMTLAAAREPG
jgi:hypothetical protein